MELLITTILSTWVILITLITILVYVQGGESDVKLGKDGFYKLSYNKAWKTVTKMAIFTGVVIWLFIR